MIGNRTDGDGHAGRMGLVSGLAGLAWLVAAGCGVYTFSGSSLPGNLKTVDIPLFINGSLQPGVAELITEKLNAKVMSSNLLRIVSTNGDATISGTVTSYSNQPYTYGANAALDANVKEYAVRITVAVEFTDTKKNAPMYKGTITGEGVYNFQAQTEDDGRMKAVNDVVDQIIQNSVQGW